MIHRLLSAQLRKVSKLYPALMVTGPRQSGKTTLCQAEFSKKPYVSLEPSDIREFATSDPRTFLAQFPNGAFLDEVQRVPSLLGYLQEDVDRNPKHGRFVLSGSQNFMMLESVSQSLAGRVGVLNLLPFSIEELKPTRYQPRDLWEYVWSGGYPRIYDKNIPPDRWLSDYLITYVERDVRSVLKVGDLRTFVTFMRLCAGRSGQELNLSKLGADAGITHNTAKAWMSVLETSFICFLLPAWHVNLKKQLIKAPKLHFVDTGLLCHLLGLRSHKELIHHPLRGAIFESWVVSEVYKWFAHRGRVPPLFHFRDAKGLEVDLLVESGGYLRPVETKSGATVASDYFDSLSSFVAAGKGRRFHKPIVVYAGNSSQTRKEADVVAWKEVAEVAWE